MQISGSRLLLALFIGTLSPLVLPGAESPAAAAGSDAAKGLLFSAGYNAQSAKAGFAAGNPEARGFSRSLQFIETPGVVKAGFQTMDNERCDYAMTGNFDPRQGTAGLWVRLDNWEPSVKRACAFFVAEIPGQYRLTLGKAAEQPEIQFQIMDLSGKRAAYRVSANIANWRSKQWHRLDAAWDAKGPKLYLDGAPAGIEDKTARPPDGVYRFPDPAENGWISINPNNFFKAEGTSAATDRTTVDEVQIHGRTLAATEIQESYATMSAQLSGGYRRPLATIPRDSTPVKLDGRLDEAEWKNAVRLPIRHVRGEPDFTPHSGEVYLKYDNENLYLGFLARGEKNPVAKAKERDGRVWEDAGFEFSCNTVGPSLPGNRKLHFILTSANVVYDALNSDTGWSGVKQTAAWVGPDGWSAEVILPFKDLGIAAPQPGSSWAGNFMHNWNQVFGGYATWAQTEGKPMEDAAIGMLAFGADSTAVRIESLGELNLGQVNAAISLNAEGKPGRRVTYSLTGQEKQAQELKPQDRLVFKNPKPVSGMNLLSLVVTGADGREEMVFSQVFEVKPPLVLSYKCWPLARQLEVTLDLSSAGEAVQAAISRGELPATIRLTGADGKQTLAEQEIRIRDKVSTWKLSFPASFSEGSYWVKAAVRCPSAPSLEEAQTLVVPSDQPLKNRAVIDHEVPDPWTPVKVDGNTVIVSDREYKLGDAPFPVQMVSLGAELFAKPIELVIETEKGRETVRWDARKAGARFDDEASFEGSGRLEKSGVAIHWKATVEFDGQWLVTFSLEPSSGPVKIRSMQMAYALRAASAGYVLAPLHRPWNDGQIQLDLFRKIDSVVDELSPGGGYWLTGHRTGLYFFTTCNANWVVKPEQPNVLIRRGKDAVDVTVKMIDETVLLARAASYTVGITATPARRQTPKDYSTDVGYMTIADGFVNDRPLIAFKSWVSLEVAKPEVLRERVDSCFKKYNIRFVFEYAAPTTLVNEDPYANYWGPTWVSPSVFGADGKHLVLCPNSNGRDLIVHHAANLAREFKVGPYFDMCGITWCDNEAHGCSYMDSFGKRCRTMPILGFRDEMKRVYKVCHKNGCRVWNHRHSWYLVPVHTFSDLWFPGEQYSHGPSGTDHFYSQKVTREEYRVEMNPLIHGARIIFLPEITSSYQMAGRKDWQKAQNEYAWYTEQLLAMLLPHDIDYYTGNLCRDPMTRVNAVYVEQAVSKHGDDPGPRAIFTGYWDNPRITVDDPALMLSYYTFPGEKRVLAVLSNPTLEKKAALLKMDLKALGLEGALTVRDEYRKEDLPQWEKGIEVPTENFRLLLIRPVPGETVRPK